MDRLIVEILPSHGHLVERRYVLEKGWTTIGRSYANDIIVDDPFVSAKHLVISRNGSKLFIKDLDSKNGTVIQGGAILKNKATPVPSGEEIRIGKTRFRLLLPDHPVEAAKPMDPLWALRQFLDRRSMAILFSIFTFTLFTWVSFQTNPTEKFWEQDFLITLMGYFAAVFMYTAILGFISYIKLHKGFLKRHLAVANASVIIGLAYAFADPFLYFWWQHSTPIFLMDNAINFAIILLPLWASFRLTQDFVTKKDWGILAAVSFSLILLSSVDEVIPRFSNKPAYPARLAPYMMPFTDPTPIDSFILEAGEKIFTSVE